MNSKKYLKSSLKQLPAFFFMLFLVASCETDKTEEEETTEEVTKLNITGEYEGHGECVITTDGVRSVITVSSETDNVEKFPDAKESLYQVNITGADNFHELEIGALHGNELWTATAEVSDSTYPVLEKYIFDVDEDGNVTGFTKIVRNPDHENFKACVIYGTKVEK